MNALEPPQDIVAGSSIRSTIISLANSAMAEVAERVGWDSGFLPEITVLDLLTIEKALGRLYDFYARVYLPPTPPPVPPTLVPTSLGFALTRNVFTSTGAHHGGQGEGPPHQNSAWDHALLKVVSALALRSCRAMMRMELRKNSKDTQSPAARSGFGQSETSPMMTPLLPVEDFV